jgi:hypothetical protein
MLCVWNFMTLGDSMYYGWGKGYRKRVCHLQVVLDICFFMKLCKPLRFTSRKSKWNVRVTVDLEVPKRIISRPTLSTVVVRRVLWCERQRGSLSRFANIGGGVPWQRDVLLIFFRFLSNVSIIVTRQDGRKWNATCVELRDFRGLYVLQLGRKGCRKRVCHLQVVLDIRFYETLYVFVYICMALCVKIDVASTT